MLSDRRPILLANARIVDPSRDFDIVGDLLIADGIIREAKKGIGAGRRAGRHRRRRLPRQAGRARPGRHARLRRRARRRPSRDLRLRQPGRRRRRRHHHHLPAQHLAGDRRSGDGRFRAAARARYRDRACASDGGADQGPRRQGDDRDRPAQGGRRGRLHRRRQERDQRAGDAARAHLRQRFRRADRASHRGPGSDRRRRDERRRIRRAARAARHSEGGGNGHARARHPSGRAVGRALSRRLGHLRGIARGAAPRQGRRPQRHRLVLDQSHHAQRKRHRALPHLPETVAAVARRGRPQAAGRPRSRAA